MIIVCDSVWKIKPSRTYETLMLDEINMILERVRVCKYPKQVFATLVRLVRHATRVIVMDAYASETALYFLETCCKIPRSQQHWRGSTYSPHRQLQYTIYCDHEKGLEALHADLKAGKNVAIISGEKAQMQAHLGALTGKGPELHESLSGLLSKLAEDCGLTDEQIASITGDSPQSLKDRFGSGPNTFCESIRVLAFTSAVLAGNSVDISRFHAVYVFSFGTVLSGQMIGQMVHRIRDIMDRRVNVLCCKGVWTGYEVKGDGKNISKGDLKQTKRPKETLEDALCRMTRGERLTHYSKEHDRRQRQDVPDLVQTLHGYEVQDPTGFHGLMARLNREQRNTRLCAVTDLVQVALHEGSTVSFVRPMPIVVAPATAADAHNKAVSLGEKEIRKQKRQDVASAPVLPPQRVEDIIRQQRSRTKEEKAGMHKHFLKARYKVPEECVTLEFVSRFWDESGKLRFERYERTKALRTFEHANTGYDEFRAMLEQAEWGSDKDKLRCMQLYVAHRIFRIAGFASAFDTKRISKEDWEAAAPQRDVQIMQVLKWWYEFKKTSMPKSKSREEPSAVQRAQPVMREILGFKGVHKHSMSKNNYAMEVSIANVYRAHGETDADEAVRCRKVLKNPHVWRPVV